MSAELFMTLFAREKAESAEMAKMMKSKALMPKTLFELILAFIMGFLVGSSMTFLWIVFYGVQR